MPRLPRITSADMREPLTAREADILHLMVGGLSNREIGLQLFLSEGTVKWHNQHIFAKLGVTSRTAAISKAHTLGLFRRPLVATDRAAKHHLPAQPTAFIGREQELAGILERIRQPDCRLLTLIGAGGSGKTRLALQTGTHLLPEFRDGVFFTPLEAVASSDQVIAAIAQACHLHFYPGLDQRQQLCDYLQHKEVLLILDNLEHLLDAPADVLLLLEHAQHLKVLITSRIPLQVREEWVLPVSGMAYPEEPSTASSEDFDAVKLFLACASRSGRKLSMEQDLPSIITICHLTQGMPLALELAASWLRTLTCERSRMS